MNHIAPRPEPLIREIPLSRLALAPENVRKTPPDACADAEIKVSIAAHGLLENLVARPEGDDPDGAYAVVAGGRRLAALKALAEDGAIGAHYPVPCLIATNGNAGELSLAENVVRIAMHPADQVVAFAGLAASGATAAAIAARFGVSERTVEQRLRLGNAAPELLEAYRAGEIDLQILMAFAVTADHARQRAVWEQVSGQPYRTAAWQVKRMLTEERVPAGTAVARFVGVDAYEAAGGPVLRDLFADEREHGVWLEDPVLLEKLATEKLQAAADELSTRWKWAEPVVEVDWSATARYGRIHPEPGEPTDEEKAEIEKLRTRHDELVNLDEEDWTDELVEEAEAIEPRLHEIEAAVASRARFKPEDFAIAGCIATVGRDGSIQVIQGLVKPEDMPKPVESSTDQHAGGGQGDADAATTGTQRIAGPALSTSVQSPRDREAEARKEAGVGIGLADDLRSVRTALVKAHLAGDFEAAFDLMLFQMGRAVFTPAHQDHALDIAVRETADRPKMRMNEAEFADWSPGEAMLEDRSRLSFDWLEIQDRAGSFAALRALPQAAKQALFAACVARTLNGQLAFEHGARPELEATVARLDIDFARHVRPTADLYWSRIAKGRIMETARSVCGPAWASPRSKYKKPALAKAMEEAFAAGDPPLGLGADAHAAALAWTMPGFAAFDAGSVDEEDADAAVPDVPAAEASSATVDPAADPRPSFEDRKRAHEADIDIAPPPPVLRPWRPGTADVEDWREPPKLAQAGEDALIMACDPEPPEAQTLWRAAERAGIAPRLFEADRRLEGYAWYDAIERAVRLRTEVTAGRRPYPLDRYPVPERTGGPVAPLPQRPDAIRIGLTVRAGKEVGRMVDLAADLAFAGEAWSWVGDALPLVTADADLESWQLAQIMRAAFFSPSDDADADSWERQRDVFDQEALHIATKLLVSDDEARRTSIADAVARELFWLIPRDRAVDIAVRDRKVTVTLGEPAEEPAP